jgi:hypothetical protein
VAASLDENARNKNLKESTTVILLAPSWKVATRLLHSHALAMSTRYIHKTCNTGALPPQLITNTNLKDVAIIKNEMMEIPPELQQHLCP